LSDFNYARSAVFALAPTFWPVVRLGWFFDHPLVGDLGLQGQSPVRRRGSGGWLDQIPAAALVRGLAPAVSSSSRSFLLGQRRALVA